MKLLCKVATGAAGVACPQGLTICCGTCDQKWVCDCVCTCKDMHEPQTCPDAEVITGELTQFQSAVPDTIKQITNLVRAKKEMDEQEKALKQKLVEAMEAYGVKSFENEFIKMTYVAPTTRSTIDSTRLKKDHPDIAEQYTKTSNVSASVRVTVK